MPRPLCGENSVSNPLVWQYFCEQMLHQDDCACSTGRKAKYLRKLIHYLDNSDFGLTRIIFHYSVCIHPVKDDKSCGLEPQKGKKLCPSLRSCGVSLLHRKMSDIICDHSACCSFFCYTSIKYPTHQFLIYTSIVPPPIRFLVYTSKKAVIYPHTWQTQPYETSVPTAEGNTPAQLFPSSLMGLENPFLKPLNQKHPKELMSSNTTSMMLRNKTLSIQKKTNLIPKSNSRNP